MAISPKAAVPEVSSVLFASIVPQLPADLVPFPPVISSQLACHKSAAYWRPPDPAIALSSLFLILVLSFDTQSLILAGSGQLLLWFLTQDLTM